VCACFVFDELLNWVIRNAILSLCSVDYIEEEEEEGDLVSPCSTLHQKSFVLDQIKPEHDYLVITDYKAHFACF